MLVLYYKWVSFALRKQVKLKKVFLKNPPSPFPVKAENFHRLFITETNFFTFMIFNSFISSQCTYHIWWSFLQSLVSCCPPSQLSIRKSHDTKMKSKWGGRRGGKITVPSHICCFCPGMVPDTTHLDRRMSCVFSWPFPPSYKWCYLKG